MWEEPPRSGRHAEPLCSVEVLEQLRQHPKRWARVRDYDGAGSAAGACGRLKKGSVLGMEAAAWEARSKRTGSGSALYLRYVGEGA